MELCKYQYMLYFTLNILYLILAGKVEYVLAKIFYFHIEYIVFKVDNKIGEHPQIRFILFIVLLEDKSLTNNLLMNVQTNKK